MGRSPQRGAVAVLALLGITAIDVVCAMALRREARQQQGRARVHYGGRSGFPRSAQHMRGVAVSDAIQRPPATAASPAGQASSAVRPVA